MLIHDILHVIYHTYGTIINNVKDRIIEFLLVYHIMELLTVNKEQYQNA